MNPDSLEEGSFALNPGGLAPAGTSGATAGADGGGLVALTTDHYNIPSASQLDVAVPENLVGTNNYVVLSMDMINQADQAGLEAGGATEANLGWERIYVPVGDGNVNIDLGDYGFGTGNSFNAEAWNLRVVHFDDIEGHGIAGLGDRLDNGAYVQDTSGHLGTFAKEVKPELAFGNHFGFDDSLCNNTTLEVTQGATPGLDDKVINLHGGTWNYDSAAQAGGNSEYDPGTTTFTYERGHNYDLVSANIVGGAAPAVTESGGCELPWDVLGEGPMLFAKDDAHVALFSADGESIYKDIGSDRAWINGQTIRDFTDNVVTEQGSINSYDLFRQMVIPLGDLVADHGGLDREIVGNPFADYARDISTDSNLYTTGSRVALSAAELDQVARCANEFYLDNMLEDPQIDKIRLGIAALNDVLLEGDAESILADGSRLRIIPGGTI